MKRRILGQTNIEVSALGFGCVQLTSHLEKRKAVEILEHAFAEGITHFDTARSYGFGRSEGILAEFLRGKRNQVTVTTKFGFELPAGFARNPRLISLAKKMLSPFPGVLNRVRNRAGSMVKGGAFRPEIAIESLETSLRELQTDYIDLLLLHEATLADAQNEPLIEALQQQVIKGKIRCFGIASDFEKLDKTTALIPSPYKILQFNDSIFERNIPKFLCDEKKGFITHSIFKHSKTLQKYIMAYPKETQLASALIGVDLCDSNTINRLLSHYAFRSNNEGVVLFSSMNPSHISMNVAEADFRRFDDVQLLGFVQFANELLMKRAPQDVFV